MAFLYFYMEDALKYLIFTILIISDVCFANLVEGTVKNELVNPKKMANFRYISPRTSLNNLYLSF
ncbi:hypothetical protein VAZ01S_055_00030 [Vibrio azureus NBRC 104587]|uniref:Uncharacterized protein n=1 Tax=Vibrio azureus NBRC 104587 TaxID=1219077 RepID=U3AUG1_9VIBR|nr:hypothetical protein VAZ01S_055_00030 [Vibrio azureus NBRC 104587]